MKIQFNFAGASVRNTDKAVYKYSRRILVSSIRLEGLAGRKTPMSAGQGVALDDVGDRRAMRVWVAPMPASAFVITNAPTEQTIKLPYDETEVGYVSISRHGRVVVRPSSFAGIYDAPAPEGVNGPSYKFFKDGPYQYALIGSPRLCQVPWVGEDVIFKIHSIYEDGIGSIRAVALDQQMIEAARAEGEAHPWAKWAPWVWFPSANKKLQATLAKLAERKDFVALGLDEFLVPRAISVLASDHRQEFTL